MKVIKFLTFGLLCLLMYPVWAQKKPNILFCIADDWGKHAGIYGDKVVKTPNFDRLAREGVVFTNAFCGSPSCTPSRATILTGRYPHQNEESGNLWSTLQTKLPNYASILAQNGYHVGLERKGWGQAISKSVVMRKILRVKATKTLTNSWKNDPPTVLFVIGLVAKTRIGCMKQERENPRA